MGCICPTYWCAGPLLSGQWPVICPTWLPKTYFQVTLQVYILMQICIEVSHLPFMLSFSLFHVRFVLYFHLLELQDKLKAQLSSLVSNSSRAISQSKSYLPFFLMKGSMNRVIPFIVASGMALLQCPHAMVYCFAPGVT